MGLDVVDTYVNPAADDLVSFSIVARPQSGAPIDEIQKRLALDTLGQYRAPDALLAQIRDQLETRGFEVFRLPSPVVSARGTVALFQSVFGGDLVKRIREIRTERGTRVVSAIVLRPGAALPSPQSIEGALLVAIVAPPLYVAPAIPPEAKGFSLHLPGDIAQLTGASATHRQTTPLGQRATGAGVGVAVIDSGFAVHPYYTQHEYRIVRNAAPDTTSPEVDDEPHGTAVLAALLACAPDVDAYGIKVGDNVVLAFDLAMTLPALKIVSVSWVYDLVTEVDVPFDLIPLWMRILDTISAGVVVIAAGGNGQTAFPAMIPEVIAVGGVAVDTSDNLTAWSGASSFASAIFKGRNVPDLCGLASDMWLPVPVKSGDAWIPDTGTSFAAPQISGIAALLLQKTPGLTPDKVLTAITDSARDITKGTTAFGDKAGKGRDLATGAGLVSARSAWDSV